MTPLSCCWCNTRFPSLTRVAVSSSATGLPWRHDSCSVVTRPFGCNPPRGFSVSLCHSARPRWKQGRVVVSLCSNRFSFSVVQVSPLFDLPNAVADLPQIVELILAFVVLLPGFACCKSECSTQMPPSPERLVSLRFESRRLTSIFYGY